jgi:hypothetical protein
MCDRHFEAVNLKGTAERLMTPLGVAAGVLAGLLAAVLLLMRWADGSSLFVKFFIATIFGFGIFLLVWYVVAVLIAPLLAVPESKKSRNAVKIRRYIPTDQMVQLEFQNEKMAEVMRSINR